MAIGKTAYIREFNKEEIKILNSLAMDYGLKNATDIIKRCLKEHPELTAELKRSKIVNSRLMLELEQERLKITKLKEQIQDFLSAEDTLNSKKVALSNLI